MWPDEYHSIILSIFLLRYLNCRFEKIYKYFIEEGDGFEDDEDEYLSENVIYLYPKSRWNAFAYQMNNKEFRFALVDTLKIIEYENPQFKGITDEIPQKIDDYFFKVIMGIIGRFENKDELFWLDLYKYYLDIFKDTEDVPKSFIRILDNFESIN